MIFDQTYANCLNACHTCISACESWLGRMGRANRLVEKSHCAALCESSIRLCRLVIEELKLRSAFSIQVCALGTVICRACAEECTAEPDGVDCATACRRAAEECHAIAAMAKASVPMPAR